MVVTEKARYWAVEDIFPAGRPKFEKAEGVFMEKSYQEIKKYEDMKLRILNMSHSLIAGLGVLLGYRGKYGIYNAMQEQGDHRVNQPDHRHCNRNGRATETDGPEGFCQGGD